MPFRSPESEDPGLALPADPLERFEQLLTALDAGRGWMQDKVAVRLAAIALLITPGDAGRLAATTRSVSAVLHHRLGAFSSVDDSVRLVIAAQLVKAGDEPDPFVDDLERVRELFRADGLRRGGVYEVLAVLVLRRVVGTIGAPQVERFRQIYAAMKAHHWWLTGPEDFPACAMLVGLPGEPAAMGAGIDEIYNALHEQAGLARGDALQTAANMLYLGGVEASTITGRFALLMEKFRGAGAPIGKDEYDELAILCFLARPAEHIVAAVIELRDQLCERLRWLRQGAAFSLAASLAFVRLAGERGALTTLADAKLLLDMQAIVTARQAAAVA
jgi:hypothetical protein